MVVVAVVVAGVCLLRKKSKSSDDTYNAASEGKGSEDYGASQGAYSGQGSQYSAGSAISVADESQTYGDPV